MRKFQKSRSELLYELSGFLGDVVEGLRETRHGTPQQKREYRKLKLVKEEVNKWLDEMIKDELKIKAREILHVAD